LEKISRKTFVNVLRGIPPKSGVGPAPAEGLILWNAKFRASIIWKYIIYEDEIRSWILNRVKSYVVKLKNKWVFPTD